MIKIGTKFNHVYADSNYTWKVIGKNAKDVWTCEIIDLDYMGLKKAFFTHEIKAAIEINKFWKDAKTDRDSFYSLLEEGQIVHYHNGFGSFVRCLVTADKTLLPVALVGNWSEWDLPKRGPNGEINYAYYPRKIVNKETFTPNASNIWEHNPNNKPDPRKLKEISLEVPEITPLEKIKADKYKKLDLIRNLLNEHSEDPDKTLNKIKDIVLN